MAKEETPRVKTPPEEKYVNVRRQAPTPGLQEDAGNPYPVDPNQEPMNDVDRDDQPVADRARGVTGMWDREDADPEEVLDPAEDVEVHHIPGGKKNG